MKYLRVVPRGGVMVARGEGEGGEEAVERGRARRAMRKGTKDVGGAGSRGRRFG